MKDQKLQPLSLPKQLQLGRLRLGKDARPIAAKSTTPIRAAQYLRMSTENQRYSVINQVAAISEYANANNFHPVVSYADPGKSGLSLKHRPGLQQLLSDAVDPERTFDAVLVLDVSRWGRFQDPDQAGHYEFICRQAGLQIIYCAEPFQGEDSTMSALVKDLKRVMASEYSRELSDKMHRAKMRLARQGFKQGGPGLPYGFDRLLVDEKRQPRFVLEKGQRKSLKTDRIVIVPGSLHQREVIARIFRLFVRDKIGVARIANRLNDSDIPGNGGKPWTLSMVRTVLTSELCIGIYAYNRTRKILQGPEVRNPKEEWVRVEIMKPIISETIFRAAQEGLRTRHGQITSTEQILLGLQRLLKAKGRISRSLVKACSYLPHPNTIDLRFGNLGHACTLIGHPRPKSTSSPLRAKAMSDDDIFRNLRALHKQNGYVTRGLINADRELLGAQYVQKRFGTLYRAFALAGLQAVTHSDVIKMARARCKLRENAVLEAGGAIKQRHTSRELIAGLKRLLREHGYLSARLIDQDTHMPCAATVRLRFGTLRNAYKRAGWARTHRQITMAAMESRYHAERTAA
jgi:DNA invertase Pin-like site-specific DNA recombinase